MLPFLLIPLAIGAGAGGMGMAFKGVDDIAGAKELCKIAENLNDKIQICFKETSENTQLRLEQLGKTELKTIASFKEFADAFEKIQNRPDFILHESNTTSTTVATTNKTTSRTTAITNVTTLPTTTTLVTTAILNLGDVDDNKTVDALDASLVLTAYAMKATGQTPNLDSEHMKAADVNNDGNVDALDATLILGYYAYKATGGEKNIIIYLNNT